MASELEQLVEGLDEKGVLENLQNLIDQTFIIENDYKSLRQTFDDVLETQSNALWIIEEGGGIYLQNSKAQRLSELFSQLHYDEKEYELEFQGRSYLVKVNRSPDKIIVSATDITEQKRKESLATMGQMAAHLSHEIRNPIGSIALLTSTLLKRVKTENKPIVFEIQKSIFRIERIIKATLMFSKGVQASKERFSLQSIGEELENAVSFYSYGKDIDFAFNFPAAQVEADLDLLVMVFSNFVFNAIDAIEEDENEEGRVEITYRHDDKEHIFQITDSGVPIANPQELFEAFKSTKEKGNGLGLVLSKQIIECHEGNICLIEEGPKGFEIRLPKL